MKKLQSLNIILAIAGLTLVSYSVASNNNFTANLSGDNEVPPVTTHARGQVVMNMRGGTLKYKLIVANISDVVAAHIHCAPSGANGAVGITLFSGVPTTINGILTQGPLLAPDSGNACGWADIDDLVDAMAMGGAYVNVHTLSNLSGEIRGQVR